MKLFSRGGSVTAAMEIGRLVRRYGLTTSPPPHSSWRVEEFGLLMAQNLCYSISAEDDLLKYDFLTGEGNLDCEWTSACALIWAAGIFPSFQSF